DLVDRLDVGKVRYVGGHSDDVGDLAARRLHDRLDVLPRLTRLRLSVARTDDPEFLVERHLAGDEEQVADLDAVGVGPRQRVNRLPWADELLLAGVNHGATPPYEMQRRSILAELYPGSLPSPKEVVHNPGLGVPPWNAATTEPARRRSAVRVLGSSARSSARSAG